MYLVSIVFSFYSKKKGWLSEGGGGSSFFCLRILRYTFMDNSLFTYHTSKKRNRIPVWPCFEDEKN